MATTVMGITKTTGRLLSLTPAWKAAGERSAIPVAAVVFGCLLSLPLALGSVWGVMVFAGLWGIANGLMTLVKPLAIERVSTPEAFARTSGRVHRIVAFGRAGAPMLAIPIIEDPGGYVLLSWILVGFGAGFFGLMMHLIHGEQAR